jgi:hypothetical protein
VIQEHRRPAFKAPSECAPIILSLILAGRGALGRGLQRQQRRRLRGALAKARRDSEPPRSQILKIDAATQLISDIFPFHEREAKSISPSEAIRRPSET